MASIRESNFSTIKCSLCNADVEISLMGDHVCMSAAEGSELSDFPLPKPKLAKSLLAQKPMGHIKIDPFAANRLFRDQVTPTSSTAGSRTHSPAAPQDCQPLRTPLHHGSLSPNHQSRNPTHQPRKDSSSSSSYNIGSPFALFRPANVHTPSSSNSVYPNCELYAPVSPLSGGSKSVVARMNNIAPGPFGVGSVNSSRERTPEVLPSSSGNPLENRPARAVKGDMEILPAVAASFPERDETGMVWPRQSPNGGHSSMDSPTMGRNGVAERESWKKGRDKEQRPNSNSERPARLSSRLRRSQSPGGSEAGRIRRKEQHVSQVPSLSNSVRERDGEGSPLNPISPYGHRPIKSEALTSIPKMDALRLDTRSQSFPIKQDSKPPGSRKPPHPGLGLPRSPSVTVRSHTHRRSKSSANLTKGLPAPPEASLPALPTKDQPDRRRPSVGSNTISSDGLERRSGSKPLPLRRLSPPRTDEYTHYSSGNPYDPKTPVEQPALHIPSPSMSSNASSVFSNNSKSSRSSMSSPPISVTSQAAKLPPKSSRGSRGHSGGGNGLGDIDGLMEELQDSMHVPQASPVKPKHPIEELPRDKPRVPPHERKAPAPVNPQRPSSPIKYEKPLPNPTEPFSVPGLSQISPPPPRDKSPARAQPPPAPRTQPPPVDGPAAAAPRRRRTAVSKGNCRGCGEAIVGKSISSADGRLTGRYHKACFVCQACRQPFQSAEFYVLENLPYCHRHYHKLNSSLCLSCDRGIEGLCLETETNERFHPNCFRCYDCRCELGGDYFDFNGRPYCERHAYRMVQGIRNGNLGANRSLANMERRSTRLMFM